MKTIGNIIWLFFGGFWLWLSWMVAGVISCITVIGIPVGLQCFKLAKLAFWPFGSVIRYRSSAVSVIANVLWLVVGIPLAIVAFVDGILFSVTIIGIPFGIQCFKLAKLSLFPFGAHVLSEDDEAYYF